MDTITTDDIRIGYLEKRLLEAFGHTPEGVWCYPAACLYVLGSAQTDLGDTGAMVARQLLEMAGVFR